MKKEKERKQANNKKRSKSRVWHIVKVITKYNAVLKLNPDKLKLMLEELGPTYVKLGQLMSMRADIIPLEYCKALEGLRTNVKPMPFSCVVSILESEWGRKIGEVCESIDEEPLGSASIAQVHKARLKTGEDVVIKVQRENIYDVMQKDIKMLKKASKLLKMSKKMGNLIDYSGLLDEMWRVAKEEMDFLHEAENMRKLMECNKDINYIKVPIVYEDYTTDKVLVMEHIGGVCIDSIESLISKEYDINEIATKLCENYIKQVITDGFYHADPHPGNIRVEDGKIVWLDMGMMGTLSERDRMLLYNAINAIIENDANTLKDICLVMGNVYGEIDHNKFYQDISIFLSKYADIDLQSMDITAIFNDFTTIANENNISVPKNLTMFGRGLMSIEGVIEKLDANISLMQVLNNYFTSSIKDSLSFEKLRDVFLPKTYASVKKTLEIPTLLSDYLKQWAKGQSKIGVDLNVNSKSLNSANRWINKIAMSVIMSFLILGGSICTLSTDLHYFWGMPIVSWVMYFGAFCIGVVLVFPIIKRFFNRFK